MVCACIKLQILSSPYVWSFSAKISDQNWIASLFSSVFRNKCHHGLYDFRHHHSNNMIRCWYKWFSSPRIRKTCHSRGSNGVRSMRVTVGVKSSLAPVAVSYPVCESLSLWIEILYNIYRSNTQSCKKYTLEIFLYKTIEQTRISQHLERKNTYICFKYLNRHDHSILLDNKNGHK